MSWVGFLRGDMEEDPKERRLGCQELGHYRLLEKLGAGGMGEVYRAEDCRLHRFIALKILSPERASQPRSLERFRREACSVAALSHPNIVTIHSVEEHRGLHFLTMELVQGKVLSELIPSDGMPLRRLLEISVPLAEALEAAHEKGIVHRDLKPANVMVSREGRVKVLDFGIAKPEPDAEPTVVEGESPLRETLTSSGLLVGTPSYMSPEQILGKPVDHRADLFAFGVLLFEMATGQRPFRGSGPGELFAAILRDAPPQPSSLNARIPAVLDGLITRCLEKEMGRRIQDARDLRQTLQALAVGLSTPPAPSVSSLQFRPRSKRTAAILAVTGCLALALSSAVPPILRFLPILPGAVHEARGSHRPGLAVLPLGNFSNEPEYFVEGMTDALISSLADIRGMRVISRQSVMRYKASSAPLPQIARELGVEMIVLGSVTRAGNRVRITAQLIQAQPEQQIWSRSYERDLRDMLSLQTEVARAISREIKVKLDPGDRRRMTAEQRVDPEAYEEYLRGLHSLDQRSPAGISSALNHFRKALAQDPLFAPAQAGLADAYSLAAFYGWIPPPDAFRQAREHARNALKIDSDLADAHVSLGQIQLLADRDWAGAEASFRRAIALKPNHSTAHYFYWLHLLVQGRREEATKQLRLAWALDPLSPSITMNMGLEAYLDGRDREAVELFEEAQALAPDFLGPLLYLSNLYGRQGKSELAFECFRKVLELQFPEIKREVDQAFEEGGKKSALQAAAKSLERLSRERVVRPEDIARVYLRLDDRDRALDYLEEAYERGFPGVVILDATGGWESVRSEPRFQELLRRIGAPPRELEQEPLPRSLARGVS